MFMSSSDGPRPSLCCRPPFCLFSAWKLLRYQSYPRWWSDKIFYWNEWPPGRDAWRRDNGENLAAQSSLFFLVPETLPPLPMILLISMVLLLPASFLEEVGQGRKQGRDSSSWRFAACSARWWLPPGQWGRSRRRRQVRRWTRWRRWNSFGLKNLLLDNF